MALTLTLSGILSLGSNMALTLGVNLVLTLVSLSNYNACISPYSQLCVLSKLYKPVH